MGFVFLVFHLLLAFSNLTCTVRMILLLHRWLEESSMNTTVLPTEIGRLSNLQEFASDNMITGRGTIASASTSTSTTIPTELGNCQAMRWMHLDRYGGLIPTELGRLTNMESLSMSDGTMTGSIPSEIGLLTKMRELELYNNNLKGKLPSSFGNLQALMDFNIFRNDLTGSIPSGMCATTLNIAIQRDCSIDQCKCCFLPCKHSAT